MTQWLSRFAAIVLIGCFLPAAASAAADPLVHAVQEALVDEGYDPGWPDGKLGPKTRRAIAAFEEDFGMQITGEVTPDLVQSLGLAAYASELGVMQFDNVRTLAPPPGIAREIVSENASIDTDTGRSSPGNGQLAQNATVETSKPPLSPVFRVRDSHPLLPSLERPAETPVAALRTAPEQPPQTETARHRQPTPQNLSPPPITAKNASPPAVPPVADRFAPRNWLVRDFQADGLAASPAFGIFLEEGGNVAGPRFAGRLRWEAEGPRFTMTYRNSIGQEIVRTGTLNGLNRIEGHATGPNGAIWRWQAEAKPL